MPTASPALVPTFISFDDDDDDDDFFGEFEFATSVSASSSPYLPPPPPHCSDSNHKQRQPAVGEDDDDWGDFVEGSLQPQLFGFSDPPTPPPPPNSSASSSAHFPSFFDPPFPATEANPPDLALIRPPPPVALNNGWQKPSGALPLSLFGGEDDEEDGGGVEASNSIDSLMPDLKAGLSPSPKSPGSKGLVSANGGGIKDLIASLYGQADKVGTATPGNRAENGDNLMINGDGGAKSVYADGGDNDEDELDDWEFKDALSSASVGDSGDSVLVEIVKKDGELAGITRFQSKAEDNGSGLQVFSNYIFEFNGQERENTLGTSLSSRAFAIEQEWGSAFVSHGTTVNGFDFGFADNGCNSFTSNALHDLEHINIENGLYSNVANGDLSLDDSYWEFRDASSVVEIVKHFTEPESINQMAPNELGEPAGRNKNQDFGDAFLITEGYPYVVNSIDNGTENNKAGSVVDLNDLMLSMYSDTCHVSAVIPKQITHGEQISAVSSESLKGADSTDLKCSGLESDKIRDNDFVSKTMDTEITTVVNFYSRLKQKSFILARHHIDNNELRKAAEQEMTDEELEAVNFDDEIKAAISKLGTTTPKSDYIEKCPPNEFSISELLEVVQEPCFQAFDMEYHLSEKIPLAEKDLGSAMWLFEHASAVHHILMLASREEQRSFINSWSKMVSACELELQHGAIIWSQALHANGQTQLLSESRGEQQFFALGEIYRVVEILSATIRLYKPWILLNPADSRDMLMHMEKSVETWTNSGLKQALDIISESSGELNVATEKLLISTNFICELSTSTLQNLLSNHEAYFCRLSLLPLEMLSDIKPVVWNGGHYFSRLANLWANRISFSAPQLPNMKVAQ